MIQPRVQVLNIVQLYSSIYQLCFVHNADIDECSSDLSNLCDHLCNNLYCTEGRYNCSCYETYQLNKDGHTCKGIGSIFISGKECTPFFITFCTTGHIDKFGLGMSSFGINPTCLKSRNEESIQINIPTLGIPMGTNTYWKIFVSF